MKYKVYPDGYDPHVASGPPPEDFIKMGVTWTLEETTEAQKLKKKYTISSSPVIGRWNEKIIDEKGNEMDSIEQAM